MYVLQSLLFALVNLKTTLETYQKLFGTRCSRVVFSGIGIVSQYSRFAIFLYTELFRRQSDPFGWVDFREGETVFVIERRPRELAVWLQGHPEEASTVEVGVDHSLLRIRYGPQTPTPLRVNYDSKSSVLLGSTVHSLQYCILSRFYLKIQITLCSYNYTYVLLFPK